MFCTVFKVTGRGIFPFDMLRYDCCFPQSSDDAAQMDTEVRHRRTVTLVRYTKTRHQNLTEARWDSFGWSVVPLSIQQDKM